MIMQTTLTIGMIRFLNGKNGKDLITSAYEFRIEYGLTREEACYLIEKWMDIPTI